MTLLLLLALLSLSEPFLTPDVSEWQGFEFKELRKKGQFEGCYGAYVSVSGEDAVRVTLQASISEDAGYTFLWAEAFREVNGHMELRKIDHFYVLNSEDDEYELLRHEIEGATEIFIIKSDKGIDIASRYASDDSIKGAVTPVGNYDIQFSFIKYEDLNDEADHFLACLLKFRSLFE